MGYSGSVLLSCQKPGNFSLDPYIYNRITSACILKNGHSIFPFAPMRLRSDKDHKKQGTNVNNLVSLPIIPSKALKL